MNFFKSINRIVWIVGITTLIGAGSLLAYASWNEPSNSPPSPNLGAPLTPTSDGQAKIGALELNFNSTANSPGTDPYGLIVNGRVLITSLPLPSFPEKLTVIGNMKIRRSLNPNGDPGHTGNLLTWNQTGGIEWQDRLGWITLLGNPSHSASACNASLPAVCPVPFVEYGPVYCLAESNGYSVPFRICHKPF